MTVELGLTDAVVSLVDERWDMAVRVGMLHDGTLQARRLDDCALVLRAALANLDAHGVPRSVDDLAQHNRLGYTLSLVSGPAQWAFGRDGGVKQKVRGHLRTNNGDALQAAALADRV